MKLKMKDLVTMTKTPKSTILYYIKEGLLPEPQKLKANVHIYDERFLYMIEFIKYLQSNFDASISQIKQIIQDKSFDFSKGYENLIDNLNILMFANKHQVYTKNELCKEAKIECEVLEQFIKDGVILEREGGFIDVDLQVAKIASTLQNLEGGKELLKSYLESAKKISEIETQVALNALTKTSNKNETSKLLLDTALILKPYIFDSMLFKSFSQTGRKSDEESTKS